MLSLSASLYLLALTAPGVPIQEGAVCVAQSAGNTISVSGTLGSFGHFSSVTINSDGSLTANFDNGSHFAAIPDGGGWEAIHAAVEDALRREATSNQ